MAQIATPNKINFKKGDNLNQSIVTIEPCYPGYGMTIGNALRRVLLSSLPGTAVIGIKIEGATHEFANLPYVKEDVLEMILNLKQLKVKILDTEAEEIKLELDITGKKEVKASDITKNSQVEIVNQDLLIANVTDMAGSLKMEITVAKGRGYRPVEAITEKKGDIGYIDMDSVFSPVLACGFNVENVRVGKMTNWDKVIMEITTDGTMTPEESYDQAVVILKEQFGALSDAEAPAEKEEKEEKEETKE